MRFLHTNTFVRYLTGDDPAKARACLRLFQALRRSQETATTSESVVAEITYVLSSPRLYHLSHEEIAARLRPLLALSGLKLPHKRSFMRALDLYGANAALDFEDAMNVAHMERLGLDELVSYDRDFDGIPGVRRVEP